LVVSTRLLAALVGEWGDEGLSCYKTAHNDEQYR